MIGIKEKPLPMSLQSLRALSLGLSFLILPSAVFGQSDVTPVRSVQALPEAMEEGEATGFIIADVNVGDIKYTELDGSVNGTFTLLGNMGQQNHIATAIVAKDKGGKVLDISIIDTDVSVQLGEIKVVSFSYRFPDFLYGQVSLFAVAETKGGVPLGTQKILEKTFPLSKTPAVSCKATEPAGSFSCFADSGSRTVTFSYFIGSLFTEPSFIGETVVIGSAKQVFAPKIPAGRYTVQAKESTGRAIYFPIRVPGEFGQIKNAIVSSASNPGMLTVTVFAPASPSRGVLAAIGLQDESGKICGTAVANAEGFVITTDIKSSCSSGIVRIDLKNANGDVLDTVSEPFSVRSINGGGEFSLPATAIDQVQEGSTIPKAIAAPLVLILIIGGIIFIGYRFRQRKLLGVFLFMLAFGVGVFGSVIPHAQGVTLGTMLMGSSEVAWWCSSTVSLDRATYFPGDTVTVTGSVDLNSDIDARGGASCTSYYWTKAAASTEPSFDLEPLVSTVQIVQTSAVAGDVGSNTDQAVFTMPGYLAPGSHSIRRVRMNLAAGCWGGCSGPSWDDGTLPFSIGTYCDLGCGGTVSWNNAAPNPIIDFSCPAGQKLIVTGSGSWSGGSCGNGTYTSPTAPAEFSCQSNTVCTACRTNIVVQSDDVCPGRCAGNKDIHRVSDPKTGSYNQAWWDSSSGGTCFGSCASYPLSGHNPAEISALPICATPPPPICVLGAGAWAGHSPVGNFGVGLDRKTTMCPAGQVMTGIRDYQWTRDVDEEFVEAYCAPGAGALGAATRREAPNAWAYENPGHKEVICPAGEVMVGAEMYGIYSAVDEEHVDAYCAPLPSATLGTPVWVSAPNAGSTMFGGYKEARCPAGSVMVGARWFQWPSNVDEEHTDAYCAPITVSCSAAANITALPGVISALPETWWQKLWKFINGVDNVAQAAGSANIIVNQASDLSWSSSGVDNCVIDAAPAIPGFPINPAGTTGAYTIPSGTLEPGVNYTVTITCTGASGGAVDSVLINVAPATDFRVCPATPIVGPAATTQMRAYYVTTGTVNCGNLAGAFEVTTNPSTNWASGNAGIATVNNVGSKGLVTGISSGSTTITATYLSYSDPETITVSCTPTVSCADAGPTATAANTCVGTNFQINDGCGSMINCGGTRTCDFNWKEVAP